MKKTKIQNQKHSKDVELTKAEPYKIGRFIEIAKKYGEFDLRTYFETSGCSYSIFLIDSDKSDLTFQDGCNSKKLLASIANDLSLTHKGISALYGWIPSIENVDIFMVNQNLIGAQNEEIIVFHEICHLLEKRKYYTSLDIQFSDDEIAVGKELEKIANKVFEKTGGWGEDKDHNSVFGSILFHYLKKFDFDNRYALLSQAMSKNFLDDYSKDFENSVSTNSSKA